MLSSKTPLIDAGDEHAKREEIRRYFHDTFDAYESLFGCLAGDAGYYLRADPLRHPLIFYYGHTAVFFVNKLLVAKLTDQRLDPRLESLLAIGVDEMSWDDLDETHYDWPTVQEVRDYRARVRALVDRKISELPLSLPIGWDDPFWIILMGIEHERIHLETSSVLIRQLPLDAVIEDHPAWPVCDIRGTHPPNSLLPVPGGEVALGRERPSPTYGWDNEYGRSVEQVADFKAGRFLVSNGEYLEFVEDGGYRSEGWWTAEGQRWLAYSRRQQPLFWVPRDDGGYRLRLMLQEIELPVDWPVEVNYLEAKAFCNWKAARMGRPIRLPTEAEWYRLRDLHVATDHPHWESAPGNINLEYWASSCPVDRFRFGDFGDIVGNVWQWTETAIDGFDGFTVHPAYDDFSVPTFDGRHNLIKGGSWISTGNEAIRDSRYAFRRHFHQHAGFRYIESEQAVEQEFNPYETDELVSQYLEFHYGRQYFDVPNYAVACVEQVLARIGPGRRERLLDIGCAVGRSAFEFARHFEHVDAVDFSTRFINNALRLREHGQLRYVVQDEGELTSLRQVSLADLGLGDTVQRVDFTQGDACNLKPIYAGYDLVFAGNLLDRLYDPRAFLELIADRLVPGACLALSSPYTWIEAYTDRRHWLGGFKEHGENLTTLDALHRVLGARFEPVGGPIDLPFVIRETARKFQHSVAQLTIWRRR